MSDVNCEGNILTDYSCVSGVYSCCDTPIPDVMCEEDKGGTICANYEICDGTEVIVSDTEFGETCCTEGTCIKDVTPSANCVDNDGTCRSSCGSDEEESFLYDCDSGSCCLAKETSEKSSKIWIWILLVLILLSASGIVFRDKLRTQWLKLKTLFGKKGDKKRFEMPLTSHSSTPQNRMFSRGILPPQLSRGPSTQRPAYPQRPLTHKKPEEKPKNELDDVLKKLKEMGK
jgi:hypothetical protein